MLWPMPSGPPKQFDPDRAIDDARDAFWRLGVAGASIASLEEATGVGRKSLYDTFGGKEDLFRLALGRYVETVIQRMCDGLIRPDRSAMENLERVLGKLASHHGSRDSHGCLLGLTMSERGPDRGGEVALVRSALRRLETSFRSAVETAQGDGSIRSSIDANDAAHALVALTQGMALMGRAGAPRASLQGAVRATLAGLRS